MRGARLVWAAFGYTVVTGVALGFFVGGATSVTTWGECVSGPDGRDVCTERTETETATGLYESDGVGGLVVLAVPVVLTAVAVAVRRSPRGRGVWLIEGWFLAVMCFLASMTIGVFYVLVPVLLLVAAHRAKRDDPARADPAPAVV